MAKRKTGRLAAGITGAGLGIAAGAALGAYVLNPSGAGISLGGGSAAEERDAARVEAEQQSQRAEEANRIIEPMVGEVVRDALADVPVVVVATPDASNEQVQAATDTLRAAGAPDAGVLRLTDKFLSADGADQLKDIVNTSLPADVQLDPERRDPGRQAGQALAPVLELGADGGERASAEDRKLLLGSLRDGGFIDYEDGTLRPAQAVLIVGNAGTVSADSGADKRFGSTLVADLAEALAEGFDGGAAAPAEGEAGAEGEQGNAAEGDGAVNAGAKSGRVVVATDPAGAGEDGLLSVLAERGFGKAEREASEGENADGGSGANGALKRVSVVSVVSDPAGQVGIVKGVKGE